MQRCGQGCASPLGCYKFGCIRDIRNMHHVTNDTILKINGLGHMGLKAEKLTEIFWGLKIKCALTGAVCSLSATSIQPLLNDRLAGCLSDYEALTSLSLQVHSNAIISLSRHHWRYHAEAWVNIAGFAYIMQERYNVKGPTFGSVTPFRDALHDSERAREQITTVMQMMNTGHATAFHLIGIA